MQTVGFVYRGATGRRTGVVPHRSAAGARLRDERKVRRIHEIPVTPENPRIYARSKPPHCAGVHDMRTERKRKTDAGCGCLCRRQYGHDIAVRISTRSCGNPERPNSPSSIFSAHGSCWSTVDISSRTTCVSGASVRFIIATGTPVRSFTAARTPIESGGSTDRFSVRADHRNRVPHHKPLTVCRRRSKRKLSALVPCQLHPHKADPSRICADKPGKVVFRPVKSIVADSAAMPPNANAAANAFIAPRLKQQNSFVVIPSIRNHLIITLSDVPLYSPRL